MLKDSNGKLIRHGDILECPDVPIGTACRYHACVAQSKGDGLDPDDIEIRDIDHNNVNMYDLYGPFYNIGPFWEHLDILCDDDLGYYFNITRECAERIAAMQGKGDA